MIPAEAVEAAMRAWGVKGEDQRKIAACILEAAAPHMLIESDLMRWKLDALEEWAYAMIIESNSPQYGHDVRVLLEVASMDEAREVDAL